VGQRVFSYRNFSTLGYGLMSLPVVLFPIGPLIMFSRDKEPVPIEITAFLVAIGVVGLLFTIKHLMTWANERILLSDSEIAWYDWLGRLKVRAPIGGITPGSLKGGMAFTVGVDGMYSNQRAWSIETSSGPIHFRSIISNCPDLVRELQRLGATPAAARQGDRNLYLTCNYHTFAMVLGAIVGLGFAFAAEYAAYMSATGQAVDEKTGQPEPIWFALMFAVAGLACLVLFVMCVLTFANERITIAGDRVLWHDRFNRDRVDCTTRDLVPGSFSSHQRTDSHGRLTNYFTYRLMTRMGPIKFDSNISHSDVLAEHLQRMTEILPPAASAPAPDNSGWSSDPLKDPNQNNIPIQ